MGSFLEIGYPFGRRASASGNLGLGIVYLFVQNVLSYSFIAVFERPSKPKASTSSSSGNNGNGTESDGFSLESIKMSETLNLPSSPPTEPQETTVSVNESYK